MAIKDLALKGKNKSRNIAKKFLKKSANKYIKQHIKLVSEGDDIIAYISDRKTNLNSYIEIKHRKTGKRIVKKIKNSQVKFSLKELYEMESSGVFDIYIKIKTKSIQHKRRVAYSYDNQPFKAILKEEMAILITYPTKNNNISLRFDKRDFDYNVTELTVHEEDKVLIKGNLEVLNDEIEGIDKLEIIGRNRLDSQSNNFNLKINEINPNKYEFEGIIDEIETGEEKIINLRMDFYIRLYDKDGIYYQNLLDLNTFKNFEDDENRFLIKIETEENVYSYYATENKHSFALWITTEGSWEKAYNIAQGRTIYNKASKEPLNEKMIFFESFFGKSYSGNPKYIYETMLEMGLNKKYTFIWAYNGEDGDIIPGNPIIVDRYEAGDYYKYLALSKYWVNNIIFPIHTKRPGNVYLQTWHGTPLKKLGYDITIPGPEIEGRQNFYNESRNWDYLISSNPYSSEIFKRAFKFEKTVLENGYPINDLFFKDNNEKIENLKAKLNIPKDKKIILYAPTWKDDERNESWEHYFNLEIDLERLYDEFRDDYIILLKMHHLVSENLVIDEKMKDFAIDLSNYGDIQELYILSDILITDYSSVFFDYAHSKRPILFFVPDLSHYIENVRGLYLNMEKELPGPLIKNNDELIDTIKNIETVEEDYKERYEEFYDRFCSLCKGQSSREIIKLVFGEE